MNGDQDRIETEANTPLPSVDAPSADTSRRNLLRLTALGGAAIATVRPGIAQAAASAIRCEIPVPDSGNDRKWIKKIDGSLVRAGTEGAFQGPNRPLKGEDVRNSLNYQTNYPGYSSDQTKAYNNYINNLTQGKQGFTCLASVRNPR